MATVADSTTDPWSFVDGEGNRRDLWVALAAAIGLGALLLLSWLTFGNRAEPPPPDPAAAAQRFADAWVAGDRDALVEVLVRRPGEDLDGALAALDQLDVTDFRVAVGDTDVDEEAGRATVVLLPEADIVDVGTWAWEATLDLERGRGSWRVRWDFTSFHPALADGVHFEVRHGVADRAPILAFDGTPLTATGEVVTIGIEPSQVPDGERLADRLSTLVPEAVEELGEVLTRPDLVPTWFYPLVNVPAERLAGIRDQVEALPGVILRSSDGRVGASAGFASHLLGRTGAATDEESAELGVEPGEVVGRSGLEAIFDEQLRGGELAEIVLVEEDGDERGVVATFSDDPAESVRTTLDADVQQAVENALVGRSDRIAIALVGPDGGLLASASRPLNGYNRAFEGAYAPGAAVWPLTLHLAVAAGADADDVVTCPGTTTVGGVRFDNLGGFDLGEVPLPLAVGEGCRTTVARLAGDLEAGALPELAGDLGFGTTPSVVVPAAASQWPAARDVAERAAAGVGQARVLSSVVHLAELAATFSDGTHDTVHLLLDDAAPSGVTLDEPARLEARALFDAAGARTGFPAGTGIVSGEGNSSEGRLAWVSVVRDDLAGVILFEQGTRQQAIDLARRLVAELDDLRDDAP